MLGLLCSLALFWTIIYAANKRRQGKSGGLPLPAYHTPRMQAAKYQVQLKPFHLIVETTAFNQIHDKFAWTLLRNPALKRVLKYFYGFGAALGVAGLLGGVGMLLWTTWKLSCLLLATSLPGGGLAKRDATVTPPRGSALPFYLIVPGITTPLGDLPVLLFSLFFSLCFHEFGHAVAAAVDNVPLTSAGTSLLVLIPSAFVSISSGTMSRLPATGRLRIASAGAHHNVLVFAILLLLGRTRFGDRMLSIGYEDVSLLGKVVISIDSDSPLNGHIVPGDMITGLNDFTLRSSLHQDLWSQYFLEPDTIPASPSIGWCVDAEWFQGQPNACCTGETPRTDNVTCFSSFPSPTAKLDRCIDPVPVMTDNHRTRCSPSGTCANNSICVTYTSSNPLLRIKINLDEETRTVLWNGPPLEVWEQVEVGEFRPRAFLYPLWLPGSLESYMSYLKTIMLSLFVMNLFPLSFLDGGQVMQATVDLLLKDSGSIQDLEAGGRGFRSLDGRERAGSRKTLIKNSAEVGTWALIGTSSALGLLHWYRS